MALESGDQDIKYLIRHELGNHTMQYVFNFTPQPIVDILFDNFAEYAKHGCANYVVQSAIKACTNEDWLEAFVKRFLAHRDDILTTTIGQEVKRALDKRLRKLGRVDLATKLHDGHRGRSRDRSGGSPSPPRRSRSSVTPTAGGRRRCVAANMSPHRFQ